MVYVEGLEITDLLMIREDKETGNIVLTLETENDFVTWELDEYAISQLSKWICPKTRVKKDDPSFIVPRINYIIGKYYKQLKPYKFDKYCYVSVREICRRGGVTRAMVDQYIRFTTFRLTKRGRQLYLRLPIDKCTELRGITKWESDVDEDVVPVENADPYKSIKDRIRYLLDNEYKETVIEQNDTCYIPVSVLYHRLKLSKSTITTFTKNSNYRMRSINGKMMLEVPEDICMDVKVWHHANEKGSKELDKRLKNHEPRPLPKD